MTGRRARAIALLSVLWACIAGHARATPGSATVESDARSELRESKALIYVEPEPPDYLRATLEEVGLLGLGFGHYLVNHDINSRDWDFTYDWKGFRKKLGATGYSFDTNGFITNFISHPGGGVMYYWAARSNRLPVFASFAYAATASAIWEYVGEFRERASVNDLLVTPIAGFVLGEATTQLGLFFDRSCDSTPNRVLGATLSPFKALHDAIDGATPLREAECDRSGLAQRGAHELHLTFSLGPLFAVAGPHTAPRMESRLELHTRVVAVSEYGRAGRGFDSFADGNVSELRLGGSWTSAEWNDFDIRAIVLPIGLHYRSLEASSAGLTGHELTFGLLFGTEYNVHVFGNTAEGTRQRDRYFALDAPGASLVYRSFMGATSLELELQSSVALAGIDPFALPEYLTRNSITSLASVTRVNAYNYAAGMRLNPRALLRRHWFEAGAELDATRLWVITELDRYPEQESHVPIGELRTRGSVWLRAGPRSWPLRFTLSSAILQRWGKIASTHAERVELRALGSIDGVL